MDTPAYEYWLLWGGRLAVPGDGRNFRLYRCEFEWVTYYVSASFRNLNEVENDPASRALHAFMNPPAGPHYTSQLAAIAQHAATLSFFAMDWQLGRPEERGVEFRTITSIADFSRIHASTPRLHRTLGERFMVGILDGNGGYDLRARGGIALGVKKVQLPDGRLEIKSYYHFN